MSALHVWRIVLKENQAVCWSTSESEFQLSFCLPIFSAVNHLAQEVGLSGEEFELWSQLEMESTGVNVQCPRYVVLSPQVKC